MDSYDFHHYSKRFCYENAENVDSNNFDCDDDDAFDEKLIMQVQSRPCLYKKNSEPLEVNNAWSDVGEALDTCGMFINKSICVTYLIKIVKH